MNSNNNTNNNNQNNSDNNMNHKESGLSFKVFLTAFCGAMLMFLVFVALCIGSFNTICEQQDALATQVEELSEDVNADEDYCRVVSKSYAGALETVVTQGDENEVDYYIVVGGFYIAVSELEYLKAKDNIGMFVTVETESKETKGADGHFKSTYSVVVTYEEDE